MKTLLLLRHAKAESRTLSKHGLSGDKDRPLSPRGIEACAAMVRYMADRNYVPDLIVASAAARTLQTAERVHALLAPGIEIKTRDGLYLAGAQTILRHVHALEDSVSSALFVGHNPGLHELACSLVSNSPSTDLWQDIRNKFPTCALAMFLFDQPDWLSCDTGGGTLVDFTYPKVLQR